MKEATCKGTIIILFVSLKPNFAVILIFIPFTTYDKGSFTEYAVGVLRMASGFSRNRPATTGPPLQGQALRFILYINI